MLPELVMRPLQLRYDGEKDVRPGEGKSGVRRSDHEERRRGGALMWYSAL